MTQRELNLELPAGLVVFSLDGRAQFGWRNPETGELYAESDGRVIPDAVGAVEWHASRAH
jgi:hypothetical protein